MKIPSKQISYNILNKHLRGIFSAEINKDLKVFFKSCLCFRRKTGQTQAIWRVKEWILMSREFGRWVESSQNVLFTGFRSNQTICPQKYFSKLDRLLAFGLSFVCNTINFCYLRFFFLKMLPKTRVEADWFHLN